MRRNLVNDDTRFPSFWGLGKARMPSRLTDGRGTKPLTNVARAA